MSDIEKRVMEVVAKKLNVELSEVKPSSTFAEDLGADSLDTVELVMGLEEEFDLEVIPDEVAEKMRTVQDAVNFIRDGTSGSDE